MFPDGKSPKTVSCFYVWDDEKKDWIKIGSSIKCDLTTEKESVWNRFWRKIRSILKGIR